MKVHHTIYTLVLTWVLLVAGAFLLFEHLPVDWTGRKPILTVVFAMVYLVPLASVVVTALRFKIMSWIPRCVGVLPGLLILAAYAVRALCR